MTKITDEITRTVKRTAQCVLRSFARFRKPREMPIRTARLL